ncbi:MAG: site-specific integrase [Burkholderiaceae bacterium]|nr:site-specific integrase [Burkholderiaceae bacterium]
MAKLIAAAKVARWRQQLFDLERLAMSGAPMDYESILKIAEGNPLLMCGGYLLAGQAAGASGIPATNLLRQASEGNLDLFVRLASAHGYLAPFHTFEIENPELDTRLLPSKSSMPAEGRSHVASGVFKVPAADVKAVASHLLGGAAVEIVVLESLNAAPGSMAFVPDETFSVSPEQVEVRSADVERMRAAMAGRITPAALQAAQGERDASLKTRAGAEGKNASRPISEAIKAFATTLLPQAVTSDKEIARMRAGLSLFVEFKGDVPVGQVDAEMLRHFRDHFLSKVPAHENRIRLTYKTRTVTESIKAVEKKDWPTMSPAERDQRMQWLARMFRWLHQQKWISDDPSTALRGESVLPKAQRTRAENARKPRQEFTPEELQLIFNLAWFKTGAGTLTKEGTYREFQPFYYWLPLLGLLTGARIGELTQMYLTDVGQTAHGTWFIDINQKTHDKSLKNEWSARRIPLHKKLIELGFLQWCERLREEGYSRVFPELTLDPVKRYTKEPIRVMSQLFARLGMPRDGTKVFHSFRHGVNNYLMKHTSMPEVMRYRLLGHIPGDDVNKKHYTSDFTPDEVAIFVNKMEISMPTIGAFKFEEGIAAIKDARRRKRGGGEAQQDPEFHRKH